MPGEFLGLLRDFVVTDSDRTDLSELVVLSVASNGIVVGAAVSFCCYRLLLESGNVGSL